MAHRIAIPKLGLTMTDCTLVSWEKADGDVVAKGDLLYAIETDKITTDVEADASGYLQRLAGTDTVHLVGSVVGMLHATREEALAAPKDAAPAPAEASTGAEPAPATAVAAAPAADVSAAPPAQAGRIRSSPLARRIAGSAGLDLAAVAGTGFGGAVLKRDVEAVLSRGQAASVASQRAVPPSPAGDGIASRRPLAGMRRAISQRMMTSLQTTAQMTGFGRVEMSAAARLRETCLASEAEFGIRITYTDIVLKAAANVLAAMPAMNASIIGDEIVDWAHVNVGLAVGLDDGLVVPVIRDADRKSLVEIGHERRGLVDRARAGTLSRDDVEGGTFSLSNFGSYGGDFETPILNPPQSALLGIGAITDEPVVRDGQIVIRPMMTISLTFDHRLIDGALAGRFRTQLRAALENPFAMMARMR